MTDGDLDLRFRENALHVQKHLEELLNARHMPAMLRESMSYSLFAGGKRLRPSLCMESCRMLSGDQTKALNAACALEMIHTYSLIHDDLPAMDDDDMRRGKPSNHVAFGEANAILAGDGLLSLAFETLAEQCGDEALCIAAKGAFDMVAGQSLDLSGCTTKESLYMTHHLKTGALIKASVLTGAACAKGTDGELKALTEFSEAYGLLFQITDDILDVTGEAAVLGKSVGKDERDGKLTFVTLYGLEGASKEAGRQALLADNALSSFGARALFFSALIRYTLHRCA